MKLDLGLTVGPQYYGGGSRHTWIHRHGKQGLFQSEERVLRDSIPKSEVKLKLKNTSLNKDGGGGGGDVPYV